MYRTAPYFVTILKQRLNSYQTGDPNRSFKMERSVLTENYRELEKHIHDKFENKHEWVCGDLGEIIAEINNYEPQKNKELFFDGI